MNPPFDAARDKPGPPLETLLRRLVDTPAEFLAEPRQGARGEVFVAALVHDFLRGRGCAADIAALEPFDVDAPATARNRLALTMIAVWLLGDECFDQHPIEAGAWLRALHAAAGDLADTAAAHHFVSDADRREELARVLLAQLELRPYGESQAQAADRLAAVSAVERKRLLKASKAAEHRAREIREALARKAAQESADKWTRD